MIKVLLRKTMKMDEVLDLETILANEPIMSEILQHGIWATLYVLLFVYTLRESRRQQDIAKKREEELRQEYRECREEERQREQKLTLFIHESMKQYEQISASVEHLSKDVEGIKTEIRLNYKHLKAESQKKNFRRRNK